MYKRQDYDICDKLYFEQLTFERVLDIYDKENPRGIIVSMGGQVPNNLSMKLHNAGLKIIGTCLLYTSDAADERSSVDLGGRRIIKKKIPRSSR